MTKETELTKLADCAGCAAKVGAGTLAELLRGIPTIRDKNLLIGYDTSDDAAVYRINSELAIVQTLDFFPPIDDDPYWYGKIAAVNALSDVYAMGGEPKTALNILCVPQEMSRETVGEILRGGYEAAYEAGAVIAGGHSILDKVPKYGLSVTGFVDPRRMWKNNGAKAGDALILTKPVGVGVLTTAMKGGMVDAQTVQRLRRQLTTLNKAARDEGVRFRIHACTDVTGFGLIGHLYEMVNGSGLAARVDTSQISFLPGALDYAEIGLLPEGMYRNRHYAQKAVDASQVDLKTADVLFSPETSGGLLFSVAPEDADGLMDALRGRVPLAQRIGDIQSRGNKAIILC